MRLIAFEDLAPTKGVHYSKMHLLRLEKAGKFPKRIRLTGGQRYAWVESEIDEWIEARIAERDTGQSVMEVA